MHIRIGTRGSKLAVRQATQVRDRLAASCPGDSFELVTIETRGDRVTDRPLSEIGGSGVFAREIERALLSGEIDLAVHSMKDLPVELPEGLCLARAWSREDARDALVTRTSCPSGSDDPLSALPPGSVVATGSVRRSRLLSMKRPDLKIVDIRGNVDTRLRKLFEPHGDEPRLDALVLAAAGLKRLGREDVISGYLDPDWMIPAANQGQLAIELRVSDAELKRKVDALGEEKADVVAEAERAFLQEIGADCHQPVGAYAQMDLGRLRMTACYGNDRRLVSVRLGGGDASTPRYLAEQAACMIRERLAGRVTLVGAGPGDAGLITVKGLAAVKAADCIVYDRLIPSDLLKEAKPDCELVYVGKADRHHTLPQDEINRLLVRKALEHTEVVRLKGGDPFVFGRGGEEMSYLRERGVRCEEIPGVSSAIAAPASAGIPLTHRGLANAFRVMTAHDCREGLSDLDFASMANRRETLVFLMGLSKLPEIVDRLIAAGRPESTPVAVLSQATTPSARQVFGTLGTIVAQVKSDGLEPPAVIVVGGVVALGTER